MSHGECIEVGIAQGLLELFCCFCHPTNPTIVIVKSLFMAHKFRVLFERSTSVVAVRRSCIVVR